MTYPLGLNDQTCANCVYWIATTTSCHHTPPVGQETGSPGWVWPVTTAADWCGSWMQIPPVTRTV